MPARVAPKDFVDRLKAIADDLDVEWSDKHERWFITHGELNGKPKYIYCCVGPNGEYRDLDERALKDLNVMFFKDRDCPDTWEHIQKENERKENENLRILDDQIHDLNTYYWDAIKGNRHIAMPSTLKQTKGGLYVPNNAG